MSDVIDFLESMGKDARLRHASHDEVGLALIDAEISPELQTAILEKDHSCLEKLLGQSPFCAVYLPSEEEDDKDEEEEAPSREPDGSPEAGKLQAEMLVD